MSRCGVKILQLGWGEGALFVRISALCTMRQMGDGGVSIPPGPLGWGLGSRGLHMQEFYRPVQNLDIHPLD